MYALPAHGMRELDATDLRAIRAGNPASAAVALAGLIATAFGWGVRFGYTVLGPMLMGRE